MKEVLKKEARRSSQLKEELERRLLPERFNESQRELKKEKDRVKSMWRTNCEQLAYYNEELAAKDEEIAKLMGKIKSRTGPVTSDPVAGIQPLLPHPLLIYARLVLLQVKLRVRCL
jgi:hypothetical protein